MKPIHLRNTPPPSETFDHVSFLENIASWIKPERYLELGVRWGNAFQRIAPHCKESWGVDMHPLEFNFPPKSKFFMKSTDNFFKELDKTIQFDMVFIDADHSYEQSLKDFNNVRNLVIEDGFIFMHDTSPYDPSYTHPSFCDNTWKAAKWIKNNLAHEWEVVTLPINPGLTILKRMDINKQLAWE